MVEYSVPAEKIRAEQWTYQTMLLRHADRILEKSASAITKSNGETRYNLLNLDNLILMLDVFTNTEEKIEKPAGLTVDLLNGDSLEQKKYFEFLCVWARRVVETFDQYGIKPYPTYEEGRDEFEGE